MFQLILAFQLELPFEGVAAGGKAAGRVRSRERSQSAKRARQDGESLPLAFERGDLTARE